VQPAAGAEGRRLYVLDESSLASTRQMHTLPTRLQPADRVLLVGDARQHQAVDAGRPYEQLQEAGIAVARLHAIKRQQDPTLKAMVERLSAGDVRLAVAGSTRRDACRRFRTAPRGCAPWRRIMRRSRPARWSCRRTMSPARR
jgi:hypothetical protein